MLIDTHTHLFAEEFNDDLPAVIERATQAGVRAFLLPNIDSSTVDPMWAVCQACPDCCYPMIGLHPTSVNEQYEAELAVVERELQSGKPYIAVGEIGLDLYWDQTFLPQQLLAFERQLEWALSYDLPVVIHIRESFAYIYKVMERFKQTPLRGVFHSFTGGVDEARELLQYPGFYVGINGVLTFKNSQLPSVLPHIPLERLLLETDSPYLAPVPYRGRRNESTYLPAICQKVAEIYGCSPEEVARQTSMQAMRLFRFEWNENPAL